MKSHLALFFSTFVTVFFAELGDKTQLATLTLTAGQRSTWTVFLGAALALVASTAIAVLVGGVLPKYISPQTTQRIAGIAFIVLGAWMLLKKAG